MTPTRAFMMLSALAVLAGGCAHGKAASGDDESIEPASVRVTNNNWSDMNIYVLRGSDRRRLGTVSSNSSTVFRLPNSVLIGGSDIRLLADPIGSSRTYVSPTLLIGPGHVVEWRLENNMNMSSALISGAH